MWIYLDFKSTRPSIMLPLDVFELVWPYYTQKQSLLKPYSFCKYHYLGQFLFN